jgi:mycoredoxin
LCATGSLFPLAGLAKARSLRHNGIVSKKAIFAVLVLLLAYQNRDRIERLFEKKGPAPTGDEAVVMYATQWCGYCRRARELLKEQNVAFVEYDIEQSAEARRRHAELGGAGVPLLNIRGTIIRGYNREAILAALK